LIHFTPREILALCWYFTAACCTLAAKRLMMCSSDGLQGNRACGVGSPHVFFGVFLAKVDQLGKIGGGKGE
jgi:hypothetical protein